MANDYAPGLEGVIAAETAVSFLDVAQEEIVVRGYDLMELARRRQYLDVAHLLLFGHLPDAREAQALAEQLQTAARRLPDAVQTVVRTLAPLMHPMDVLRTAVSALACADPVPGEVSEAANRRRAVEVLGQVPVVVANIHRYRAGQAPATPQAGRTFAADFLAMLTGREPTAEEIAAFDQLLIAYSEHEMPNSTFAARVIASTLADVYGALAGAVASLKGPLHGGANEAVMALLLQAETPDGMERLIRAKLAAGERIMGFGHRVYMRRPDPRALLMKEAAQRLGQARGDNRWLTMCEVGEAIMRQEKGLYPNLDYYAAPVLGLLGIPVDLYTPVFFVARTAGLGAHIIEQQAHNRLFRPRVRYVGPRGLHPQ